ncbi:MAG: T9SS type A sorting domain-containing protein [Melioribacteraceae bacterium]|nr:T9SS type A sorting domain-containing protein [Melioribacteraceae bacterium]
MKKLLTLFTFLFIVSSLSVAQITIDGDMSDWTADMQFDIPQRFEEGLGDSIDVDWDGVKDGIINPALDIENMFVTHDDNYIYVRLDINEDGTFADLESMVSGGMQASIELFIDADVSTETGLTWGWWATSGDYWINLSVKRGWPGFEVDVDYGILKFTGANGSDSQWEKVEGAACIVAANLDDNKMEIAIPRAAIGETNGDLESTGFIVLGEDPTAGWNADIVPNDLGGTPSIYRYGRTQIEIDGDMSDWTSLMKFDVSPNMEEGLQDSVDSDWDGVMDGIINPALDIKDVYVTHDDNYLYVRVDINEDGTFTDLENLVDGGAKAPIQLYFDTDVDSATGLTWGYWLNGGDFYVNITDADGNPGLEVAQPYGILQHTGLNGNDESFVEVEGGGCTVAINLDDNIIEVAIPRALIGETNGELESTGIMVFAEDPTTDWVNDVAPDDASGFRNMYYYGGPTTDIKTDVSVQPESFSLEQNYPNPFNPTTNIKFSLASRAVVSLEVYSILGQQVATLISNQDINAGVHTIEFNASKLSSGMYIYVIKADNFISAKKMMLLK